MFSVDIPIIGPFQLVPVKGNLNDDIKVNFSITILHGNARFHASSGWLCVDLSSTVFEKSKKTLSIQLIPLPCVIRLLKTY
ncbi:hypothetical protein B0F90DRAFT_1742831 [Multifurca ochricompacta]|uniref:Uncharacterized protein n=1 Tax=Multifurca ochricompacta TaxID=376703 RepID=A0AAD4M0Q0_9AGAM|nr:hypothetical protein B0F90DRAFT_1742831 [Multifurca ochricompacta]